MATVYFIRHAEPNYENHDDSSRELTESGLQASQDIVNLFSDIPIDFIYSSPYKRSVDTITPLALSLNRWICLMSEFRERKITDSWIEDFADFTKKQWADFSYHLPGGESLADVEKRNIPALHSILKEHPTTNIVIGTHGTALSTILHYYLPDFSYEDFQRRKHTFPWIVRCDFEGIDLHSWEEIDLKS